MVRRVELWPLAALFLAISVGPAHGLDAAARCEWDKLRTAGSYGLCRLKVATRSLRTAEPPDFGPCDARQGELWQKIEAKAGPGICPSEGDAATIRGHIATGTDELVRRLSGAALSPTCGNGIVEPGEDCDFGTLHGETCVSQGFVAGDLACSPATCVFDAGGCVTVRFVDNGDGTVTDNQTGLMWEKKNDLGGGDSLCPAGATCANPHDADNRYLWSLTGTAADGGAFTDFLAKLNDCGAGFPPTALAGGFAGYCDWRLPTLFELESLLACSVGSPCIDPIFGDTLLSQGYWSSTTYRAVPQHAFFVHFKFGVSDFDTKGAQGPVRAVRRAF